MLRWAEFGEFVVVGLGACKSLLLEFSLPLDLIEYLEASAGLLKPSLTMQVLLKSAAMPVRFASIVGSRAQRAALFTSSDSIINGKPPTIKFCPECKINPGEGICKSCLASTKSLTPAKVTKMLSEYVVGQDQVKRALGVSMFLHLQRVKANDWIKYEGKGKPKTNSSKASSSSGLDKNTSDYLEKILRGGISPNITKMIVTSEFVAKLDGKNFPTKVLLKELVDLRAVALGG
ncbi:hypothetical protein BASA81_001464 [Batrachochytrium salamandrivorans]|nr:hypothetical protein BASA81_001464 [Batrachochytrium salamandrivorans]